MWLSTKTKKKLGNMLRRTKTELVLFPCGQRHVYSSVLQGMRLRNLTLI